MFFTWSVQLTRMVLPVGCTLSLRRRFPMAM